ncbi:MAG TPA: hypothetical protein VHO66_09635 [Ruminiclostridium sp.]|nr:hypothetical protein [Ruminiclostridium sp.]
MSLVFSVAKNEIRQQTRRIAVWVGLALVAAIAAQQTIVSKDLIDYNDIGCFFGISGSIGGYIFYVVSVLCAGRLCNKKDNYFDILASTRLTTRQFYAGKVLGNVLLFCSFCFVLMLLLLPINFIKHSVVSSGFMAVPYFLIHYFFRCAMFILISIAFLAMFDILFKNPIISSILTLMYQMVVLFTARPKLLINFFLIRNPYSPYIFLTQYFFLPVGHDQYLQQTYSFEYTYGYTTLNGFISLFIAIAMIVIFYFVGLAVFKRRSSKA